MLLSRLPQNALPPRAILLAADVILLSVYEESRLAGRLFSDREPPYGTVAVQTASGAHHIAAMRLSEFRSTAEGALLSLSAIEPDLADPFNTVVLGSDVSELADELDSASQRRLLAFLLGFCAKAFGLADNAEFATACLQLARLCVPTVSDVEPLATVTAVWMVIGKLPLLGESTLFILNQNRIRRSAAPRLAGFARERLIERIDSNDILLAQGETPMLLPVTTTRTKLPDLLRTTFDPNGLRAACLHALAPICPRVATQLREATLLSPAAPRRHDDVSRPIGAALEAALPDGEGRLFLRGWVRDPMDLVAAIELNGPHGTTVLDPGDLHWFRRPDIEKHFASSPFPAGRSRPGFVALIPDPAAGLSLQPTLALRLHSGGRLEARAPLRAPLAAAARTAVLSSVPSDEVSDAMLDACLGPAAAAFNRLSLNARGTPELVRIGTLPANPVVSILVPLYRNLSFLRFQIAALARDPECRAAELIIVLDSPEQAQEVEHLLRGLHAMHGLPMLLAVLPHNLGYAAANNAAAALARAPSLLLLNSDVVPAGSSWLGNMLAALTLVDVGAVGPKLLFDDESIQHAGLFFQRDLDGVWLNSHYHKGMPRAWPGARNTREVPGVTGAALLVRKDLFEMVGGICEDYIVGDYEDSDFCLRLRTAGSRTLYVPTAELFHFERRSISLHRGYAGTLACRYNRRLHHRRWDDAIGALMSKPEFACIGAAA